MRAGLVGAAFRRPVFLIAILLALAESVATQRSAAPALPPISMTCPHHPDVIESRPGTCPICKLALIPVRLDSAWMCPIHSVIQEDRPGTCRLCRRTLVPVTVSLAFTCRGEPGVEHVDPGTCADGTPRMARRALRPHGNHNPQHGGQFFMAPDNWHHLEGTYPRERVFRLFIYDDYARALGPRRMKEVRGRVVTQEKFDPATKTTTELKKFDLRPSSDGTYLEARLDAVTLPAEMIAKVRLAKDAPEYRFDFTFTGITKDPNAPPAARRNPAAAAATPAPAAAPAPAPEADPLLVELPEPTTTVERLAQLRTRVTQIETLIRRGDFGAVWVPAFAAKDLAVALEASLAEIDAPRRPVAEIALREVVRTAWLLDSVGDAGNRQDVEEAFAAFRGAAARTSEAFGR